MKFGDKIKGAISGAKIKYNDSRFTSKLKHGDLGLSEEACKLVFEEFKSALGRDKWAIPLPGMSTEDFKGEISDLLSRIWPDDYDPEMYQGSISAVFNFVVLYFVCHLDLPCSEAKFMNTLNRGIQESSVEDVQTFFDDDQFSDEIFGVPKYESSMTEDEWIEKYTNQGPYIVSNLSELIPNYASVHFPKLPMSQVLSEAQQKIAVSKSIIDKFMQDENTLMYSGLRYGTMDQATGPKANMARYVEYYSPELMTETDLYILHYVHRNLKPDPKQIQSHWVFCETGILIVPTKNFSRKPDWIPSDQVESITFGLAYDALTSDGVTKYERYELFMFFETSDGASHILYQYLSDKQAEAKRQINKFQKETIPLLASVYDVDWTDEIIDESSHYVTRTTSTVTYWSWG